MIVNTGRGRAFQTGVDVREVSDAGGMGNRNSGGSRAQGGMTARTNDVWKPVIAAVNGLCVGAAFHFVADADIVVACPRLGGDGPLDRDAEGRRRVGPGEVTGPVECFDTLGCQAGEGGREIRNPHGI